mmetsp:Transcript_30643/g.90985  ORF Transcript_30643/g.90985 Transcript_30643/m.90985 type:complete len:272 (-) Transcript_30643:396-1211(-)
MVPTEEGLATNPQLPHQLDARLALILLGHVVESRIGNYMVKQLVRYPVQVPTVDVAEGAGAVDLRPGHGRPHDVHAQPVDIEELLRPGELVTAAAAPVQHQLPGAEAQELGHRDEDALVHVAHLLTPHAPRGLALQRLGPLDVLVDLLVKICINANGRVVRAGQTLQNGSASVVPRHHLAPGTAPSHELIVRVDHAAYAGVFRVRFRHVLVVHRALKRRVAEHESHRHHVRVEGVLRCVEGEGREGNGLAQVLLKLLWSPHQVVLRHDDHG